MIQPSKFSGWNMRQTSFLLALLILGACGKKPVRNSKTRYFFDSAILTQYSQNPIRLKKQIKNCNNTIFPSTDFELNLNLNNNPERVIKAFKDLLDGQHIRSLNGSVISATNYGLEENIDFTDPHHPVGSTKSYEKLVDLCPNTVFEKNSIESASLNTSYYINLTNQKVKEADPTLKIEPVTIFIGSLFSLTFPVEVNRKIEMKTVYKTDNAFYSPSNKSITMLPHSSEQRNIHTVNFWEIPFVPSHEYGHHIFETYMEIGAKFATHCFGHADNSAIELEVVDTRPPKARVMAGFNEGFADLIAFYSLNESETAIGTMKVLGKDRDIAELSFEKVWMDGHKKFTATRVKNYLSSSPDIMFDEHKLGAIFSYQANRLLSTYTAYKPLKLQLLLGWVKNLKSKKAALNRLSDSAYIKEIHRSFIQYVMKSTNMTFNPTFCAEIEDSHEGLRSQFPECN